MSDWFKYYRSSADHHLRSRPFIWIYWLHCLESAAWKTHEVFWDQKEFCLEKGSFITSMHRDSTKNGLSIGQIRHSRKVLAECDMISVRTTNKGTLITVSNWKAFQKKPEDESASTLQTDDKRTTNQRQTNNKPTTTTEEGKERKEGKRRKRITTAAPEYSEVFEKFWKVYPKHEDKADAFELFQELEKNYFPKNELETDLLKFAFAYAAEFKGARKKYAKKAKYILRDGEWKYWMEGAPQENTPVTKTELKPTATGIATLSAYTMMAKSKCPGIDPKAIRAAFDNGMHIDQLTKNHQPTTHHD